MSGPAEAWRTPAVEQAEARLEEVRAQADQAIAKARALRIPPTPPLSEDDVRRIEQAARSGNASREMRELQQRIDREEFTWRDVVDGRRMHDPGVRAALGANLNTMAGVYRQFDEGYQLDDVLAAHQPGPYQSDQPAPYQSHGAPPGQRGPGDDDGEWFVDSIYDEGPR